MTPFMLDTENETRISGVFGLKHFRGKREVFALTNFIILPCVSRIYMDQLEDERSPGNDTGPSGQQVPAHQALQH